MEKFLSFLTWDKVNITRFLLTQVQLWMYLIQEMAASHMTL
jgi:hypothetical protein